MKKDKTRPSCYVPQPKVAFPLCAGRRGWACERCCWYWACETGTQMTVEDLLENAHGEDCEGDW